MKIQKKLHELANPKKAEGAKRFFKTGKGQYGEGDIFIGVTIPEIRKIAKEFFLEISLQDVAKLLGSKIHEDRCLALMLLVEKFQKEKDPKKQLKITEFYLSKKNLRHVNNWDLVDLSCYKILGQHLLKNDRSAKILYDFSKSPNLWIRRIAIVSTFAFIKENHFDHTIKITKILLDDEHDLIRKACGWMLREVGKKDEKTLKNFLKQHHKKMPSIMRSYANERLRMKF